MYITYLRTPKTCTLNLEYFSNCISFACVSNLLSRKARNVIRTHRSVMSSHISGLHVTSHHVFVMLATHQMCPKQLAAGQRHKWCIKWTFNEWVPVLREGTLVLYLTRKGVILGPYGGVWKYNYPPFYRHTKKEVKRNFWINMQKKWMYYEGNQVSILSE